MLKGNDETISVIHMSLCRQKMDDTSKIKQEITIGIDDSLQMFMEITESLFTVLNIYSLSEFRMMFNVQRASQMNNVFSE